jgi:hypothetical protein
MKMNLSSQRMSTCRLETDEGSADHATEYSLRMWAA